VATSTFGRTQFQLVLLRRMADFQPELVERARVALGATVTEMREANAHWQRMIRSHTFRLTANTLSGILGSPPAQDQRVAGRSGRQLRVVEWAVPLYWPGLRITAFAGPDGAVMDYSLTREVGSSAPRPRRLADLSPWSCVISDVMAAFPPATVREGSAPSRRELLFRAPEESGAPPVPARAEFVHGLVQRVEPVDPK
jgi:hypothetical protein